MELARLANSLNAYTSLPGGNGQAQSTALQSARTAEGEAVSRSAEAEARQAGSISAPESTRVSLSKQGVERAAAETQANQQATAVAAQAATGGVTAISASTSPEAENPRSSVASVRETSTVSVRETAAQSRQVNSTTAEQNTATVEANRTRNNEAETAAAARNDQQRTQMQRDQEYSRARARQDAPSFAQSGVSAYQGVANY